MTSTSSFRIGRLDGRELVDPFVDPPKRFPLDGPADAPDGSWVRCRVDGKARVQSVLAEPGGARDRLYGLAADIGVSPEHGPAVDRETARIEAAPGIDDPELEDLRHLPFVTIDEETSKDLDQALFLEKTDDGFRVWYAIADAAHFVGPGTALMEEALRRGSTFYMPGLVLPMLPPILSEDLVSLNPRVDRRALVFRIELDPDGTARDTQILRARVHSRVKTSYDAVQRFYDGGPVPGPSDDRELTRAVAASLETLASVGQARMRLSEIRDTVRVQRRELKVTLDGDEAGFVAMDDPRLESERYNEQISLLANVEGARLLAQNAPGLDSVQPVFRFHQPPDPYRLDRLRGRLRVLAKRHGLGDDWQWNPRRQSLADFVAGLPAEGEHARLSRAVHRQVLLAGGRSGFDVAPGIHHGVGAEVYARFTAPMREVVGVFVHKETWEMLGQVEPAPDAEDEALRERVVKAADRCRGLQRRLDSEINRQVIDRLFHDRDTRYRATVMGFSRSKVHVQLDSVPVDVKVYVKHLEEQTGERLRPGRDGVTLRRTRGGQALWTVGDEVEVHPVGHDPKTDRWRLALTAT